MRYSIYDQKTKRVKYLNPSYRHLQFIERDSMDIRLRCRTSDSVKYMYILEKSLPLFVYLRSFMRTLWTRSDNSISLTILIFVTCYSELEVLVSCIHRNLSSIYHYCVRHFWLRNPEVHLLFLQITRNLPS